MRILALTSGWPDLEQRGIALLQTTSQRLRREVGTIAAGAAVPEGPHFVYQTNTDLFLGRRGRGPLRVTWDTSVLIDYFDHGRALWEDDAPVVGDEERAAQLEALQILIAVWVVRDIRFELPTAILDDAKKKLTASRRARRGNAFREFACALSLAGGDPADDSTYLHLPDSEWEWALSQLPGGYDRQLVAEAARAGAHAYLTFDKQLCRKATTVRRLGIVVTTPLELLAQLAESGALHCLLDPRCAYWPAPDLQRVSHLIRALPVGDD